MTGRTPRVCRAGLAMVSLRGRLRWRKVAASLLIILLSPTFLMAQTTQPTAFVQKLIDGKPQNIVCYGTSLTQGGAWVRQMTQALNAAFPKLVTVSNSGKSGQNSKWGAANVDKKVVDLKPDVVFIEFAVNDAVAAFNISVADAKANLTTIVDAILMGNPDTQIILQIMNPVIDRPPGHAGHRPDLSAYWEMYRAVGKDRGFIVIDHSPAWQALLDQGEDEYKKFVPDGLHPNADGYKEYVTPTILRQLGIPENK